MTISQLTLFILIILLIYIILELWKVLNTSKKIQQDLDEKLEKLNRTIQILTARLDAADKELFIDQLDEFEVDEDVKLDPLYNEAARVVYQEQNASASLIQRRLSIGYAHAARLLDQMESQGLVGKTMGSKPREVHPTAGNVDTLFDEAVKIVGEGETTSLSQLHRRLDIGYARTARIMDQLEMYGYVGPSNGEKPRAVLKK
ncbi:hypothetical protein A3G65_02480 [Candidatus Roizmanbacteria bacterium RIFCSPLOWO2_12_FULL_37_7b]|nr:MAG: hypothetical protein A3E10_01005 [Candidatus Roizmanbacteria bacterium RIFCSPHIGHO2_12_FULL_37_23]OGK59619.1 MAG: hypothetical protein A3G65_02480 [Candidatus Roizmanbacteria bacterium RIFCSPLOWO2_12_FULL_37_7b]